MERVCDPDNMNRAFKRVVSNKGAPGVDKMTVEQMREWIRENKKALLAGLLDGTYKPQPVRGVQIPKPGGGTRQLGIPVVIDRLVRQAMLQVLEPLLDPQFSDSSYGFRPKRGAHDALIKASEYVKSGRTYVVDIDLEKFFDRVNHDMLMARLARHVKDKSFLRIVRRFLESGIMQNGICTERTEGTPQGGPLSPILSNLLLDDLDKELERRGHKFCRYADDCNIYVHTWAAGQRVMVSVTRFLEGKLKLKVNQSKSAVDRTWHRKFLGYYLGKQGYLKISPVSLDRFKNRIQQLTRRNQALSFEEVIRRVNVYLTGWYAYFELGFGKSMASRLDEWIRRKLRCYRLKQCKTYAGVCDFLKSLGTALSHAYATALSSKGWWRRALSPGSAQGMTIAWFAKQGLVSLSTKYSTIPA
jgi:RNA-directed DNA polymerase